MITIAEHFPLYKTASKWLTTFREITPQETVRLEKEYTVIFNGRNITYLNKRDGHTITHKIDSKFHRRDGPAFMFVDGKLVIQIWYIHGVLHRTDGPARIDTRNGEIVWRIWFVNGVQMI